LSGQLEIRIGRLEDLQPETLGDEPGGRPGHQALAYRQNEESTGREIHHDSLVTLCALHDLADETLLDPLQSP
jgi:hypothetical protein